MNLRQQAEADLKLTLEDKDFGFAFEATVTNPAGVSAVLNIQSGDVYLLFEPESGILVANRTAHASMRISSLTAAGLGLPRAEPDESKNPWIIEFPDSNDVLRKFTVVESRPDRTLGIVTIILQLIKN